MRVIDLTQRLATDMPRYPGLPQPAFEDIAAVETDGYGMSEWRFVNHLGTHLDAPSHQVAGGDTLDDISLNRLVTEAVVLDFTSATRGALTTSDLFPHLSRIREGDVVLICSGNGGNWGTEAYWTDWCYPDVQACEALIATGLSAIGFDGPSADPVDTTTFDLHKIWLSSGVLLLENLTNLEELPERTTIVIAPMKVRAANGSPVRVLALPDV